MIITYTPTRPQYFGYLLVLFPTANRKMKVTGEALREKQRKMEFQATSVRARKRRRFILHIYLFDFKVYVFIYLFTYLLNNFLLPTYSKKKSLRVFLARS